MSFEIIRKGLKETKVECPSCNSTHTVYVDATGEIAKNDIWLELVSKSKGEYKCSYCLTVLKWIPLIKRSNTAAK